MHLSNIALVFTFLFVFNGESAWASHVEAETAEIKPSYAFKDVLLPNARKEFEQYFEIMFREDFPTPTHPLATIVNGFDCLYQRLEEAKTEEEQSEELHKTLALHKPVLNRFVKEQEEKTLIARIGEFACNACRTAARYGLGIDGEKASKELPKKPNFTLNDLLEGTYHKGA